MYHVIYSNSAIYMCYILCHVHTTNYRAIEVTNYLSVILGATLFLHFGTRFFGAGRRGRDGWHSDVRGLSSNPTQCYDQVLSF